MGYSIRATFICDSCGCEIALLTHHRDWPKLFGGLKPSAWVLTDSEVLCPSCGIAKHGAERVKEVAA